MKKLNSSRLSSCRHVARIFVGGGRGGGCVWAVKLKTCRGAGGMLPRDSCHCEGFAKIY